MKRAFKKEQKEFFIIFKRLSMKQTTQFFLEGESPTLRLKVLEMTQLYVADYQ